MKNYSIKKQEESQFILNYEIVDNNIVVNYANGQKKIIPHSTNEEKKILNKMKVQVLNSKKWRGALNNKFELFLKLFIYEVLLGLLFFAALVSSSLSLGISVIGTIAFPIVSGFTMCKLLECNKLKNDIKKHILFLRNENSLNLIIRNNPEITNNLNNKLQKKLLNNSKFYFNINSIDNLEYKDLEQIYNSIEKANNHKSNSLKKARK